VGLGFLLLRCTSFVWCLLSGTWLMVCSEVLGGRMVWVIVGILLISILLLMMVLAEETKVTGLCLGLVLLVGLSWGKGEGNGLGLESFEMSLVGLFSWILFGLGGSWMAMQLGLGVWLLMDVGMVGIGLLCGLLGMSIGLGLGSVGKENLRLMDVYECGPNAAVLEVLSLGWWSLSRIWLLYLLEAFLCGLLVLLFLGPAASMLPLTVFLWVVAVLFPFPFAWVPGAFLPFPRPLLRSDREAGVFWKEGWNGEFRWFGTGLVEWCRGKGKQVFLVVGKGIRVLFLGWFLVVGRRKHGGTRKGGSREGAEAAGNATWEGEGRRKGRKGRKGMGS